ncbi:MAG: propanediol utilization protein [Rhodobacterales bacterium]|nr:propanediol utilization protein [Rhodobacterales bacterium]
MVWVAGHFGEWVQGCTAQSGDVVLVTLPCPSFGASATWQDDPVLSVVDPSGVVGPARAVALLSQLGLAARGRITLATDLPPGGGAGMSSAALVALARAAGAAEDRIAAACLAVEGAVDPLMLSAPDAVLWAPRRAVPVRALPPPPAAEILGGFWGAPIATDPRDTAFPPIDDLIAAWMTGPDLRRAAELAQQSAQRTTALRGPADDPTPALAAQLGALGWARAHTGSARSLIFAPGAVPARAEQHLRRAGFAGVMRFSTRR